MNFEGFQDLMRRVAVEWLKAAKKEIIEMEMVTYFRWAVVVAVRLEWSAYSPSTP